MPTFGLTSDGFKIKRLSDIIAEVDEDILQSFPNANLDADSVIGQLRGIFVERFAAFWELAQQVYFSQYLSTAEGTSLDLLIEIIGESREGAKPSVANLVFFGDEGTEVPAGSRFGVSGSTLVFELDRDITISINNASYLGLEITVDDNFTYNISINDELATFTSSGSADLNEIQTGLESAINALELQVDVDFVGSDIRLIASELGTNLSFAIGSNLTVDLLGKTAKVTATTTGANPAGPDTITTELVSIPGLDSITNPEAAELGRERETDEELRQRIEDLRIITIGGFSGLIGSPIKIKTELLKITGVTNATVETNREPVQVNDMPPNSVKAIVSGGLSSEIAETLYKTVSAGIKFAGNQLFMYQNEEGQIIPIRFSRPEVLYIFIDVTLTVISSAFPSDGTTQVQNNLLETGNEEQLGNDILWQKYFEAIYKVPGITNATLTFASSSDPNTPGSYSASNISIDSDVLPSFAADRIDVVVSP